VTAEVEAGTLRAELEARRDLYRLASRLLAYEIDAPLHARLERLGMLDDPPATLDDLAAEFCRLFVGPRPVCPPYASAHGPAPSLRAEPERRFTAFLAECGLHTAVEPQVRLLALDHLAVELGVLAHLYDRADATPALRQARTLVTDHLLPWAVQVADKLAAAARLAPYTTLGTSLSTLLRQEAAVTSRDHELATRRSKPAS
jgi:TorA maturation chaperone TorD